MPQFRPRILLTTTKRSWKTINLARSASTTVTSSARPRRHYFSTALLLGGGVLFAAYYYDSRSLLHEYVVMPVIRLTANPEEGHKLAVRLLGLPKWARPRDIGYDGEELQSELFGFKLKNPIGIAAGFDKDADAIDGLFDLGFGYVEVGSVTPEPQPGNARPRFFRLEEDDAAINRYGFNSLGHGHVLARLRARILKFSLEHPSLFPSPLSSNPLPPPNLPRSLRPGQLLAVNLGKNKMSAADSNEDYVRGVRTIGPYADVVVINVSSPNTPGLRALQGKEQLQKLLTEVVEERNKIVQSGLPKIAVKITCDLTEDELADVASAVRSSGVEGVIVSNTTIRRKELKLRSAYQDEMGGLSGKPLFPYALQALHDLRPLLPPSIPIIGCGGVSTGSDALAMAHAGATVIQVYTSFGYRGVGTPRLIKDEISESLKGAKWIDQIGQDWTGQGQTMGWDEARVKQESDALKDEAKGLGDLLRRLTEKEEIANLVAQAEKALGKVSGMSLSENEKDAAKDAVGDVLPTHVVESLSQHVQSPHHTLENALDEELRVSEAALSIGEALATKPEQGVDLAPIVVLDERKSVEQGDEKDNEWRQSVKDGPKRLV
ncbi:dihydroorotate dehydrogenase (fumarate) [Cryptococcus depauperatus CBS 7841]|uniref:Dihydroorotate dehydrogenase (quinone), mitochondrial n=1 Tax=Cryptococcus depauperatus CBS 7841 TaxID=1295531 RepID=A0A1E3IN33_9TREE|nr:dihydroorotate dehydrogenase (fumarate) [Cryptococcus depauperatus CBS 7841]